jgi:YD repeat-containing protein
MNRIKKRVHARQQDTENKRPSSRKLIVIFCTMVFTAFMLVLGIGAMARNALLHESAVESNLEKQHLLQLQQCTASPPRPITKVAIRPPGYDGPMPPSTKPVATRAEAKKLMAQVSGSNSQFAYDGFGRLVKIVDPGGIVRQFVWAGDQLCEERDASGSVTKQFFGWGETIGGTPYYYTRNHLGSICEMTDSSGNTVAQCSYDSYGNVAKLKGTGPDSDFLLLS